MFVAISQTGYRCFVYSSLKLFMIAVNSSLKSRISFLTSTHTTERNYFRFQVHNKYSGYLALQLSLGNQRNRPLCQELVKGGSRIEACCQIFLNQSEVSF